MSVEPQVRERTIVKEYVTLPYRWERKGYHAPDWSKPNPHSHKGKWIEPVVKEGTVDIDLDTLVELIEYTDGQDRYFDPAFGEAAPWGDYALEQAGWATRATRGGVWATPALREWLAKRGLVDG